jgi:gas vesicle protein
MWGNNEKDEKVLIAISLRAEDNVVDLYTFPFEATSEEFYNLMLNEWRENHEVNFPPGFTHIIRPLTAADSLLPHELKVDRTDIIQRAQTEWHFIVLSNKLYQTFHDELKEIREKLKGADNYKNQLWEEMKDTWEKIQKNIFDKTLLRDHGQQLREMTNDIFTQLKNMRKELDTEVDRVSKEIADKFNKKLDEVEEKVKKRSGFAAAVQ